MKTPIINPFTIMERVGMAINRNADRVLAAVEKNQADTLVSNVREVVPFYNKFLPKEQHSHDIR